MLPGNRLNRFGCGVGQPIDKTCYRNGREPPSIPGTNYLPLPENLKFHYEGVTEVEGWTTYDLRIGLTKEDIVTPVWFKG